MSIFAEKLVANAITGVQSVRVSVGSDDRTDPYSHIMDFYYKFMVLETLSRWTPEIGRGTVLVDAYEYDMFLNSDEVLSETSLSKKWRDEQARQRQAEKYVFVTPREILETQDVLDWVSTVRKVAGIPSELPDHPKLEFICDLLDVEPFERLAVNHALYRMKGIQYSSTSRAWNSMLRSEEWSTTEKVYGWLGLTPQDTTRLLKGSLRGAGILVPGDKGPLTFEKSLSEIFASEQLSTSYIEDTLFPSSVNTQLTTADYPHVKKETVRVGQIVNRNLETGRKGINTLFWGPPGTGKTELALALANTYGWNLRVIGDISPDDPQEKTRAQRIASLKLAQKILAGDKKAVLLFDEMEDLFKADLNASFSKAFINRLIENSPIPIIWTTNSLQALEHSVLRRMVYNIHLDYPPVETRKLIWRKYCREYGLRIGAKTLDYLAQTYDIAPAVIRNAVAVSFAVVGDARGKNTDIEVKEVIASLDKLVRGGEERVVTDEYDNPHPYDITCVNSTTNIEALSRDVQEADARWSLCLYGAPGTGKSEFGRHLSKLVGKKLMLRRASDLVSMWVGETEKNIAKAFAEAAKAKKVLLIDEGDSFLRNRELARNSWEITSVNEMLSQMERHTQPFILTTNLMNDLDPAALRRFTFKMKFDFLTIEQAKRLFVQYFGCEAPPAIERNHMLAPGDFANVKTQVVIRKITDPERIYALLLDETNLKPQSSNGMGF